MPNNKMLQLLLLYLETTNFISFHEKLQQSITVLALAGLCKTRKRRKRERKTRFNLEWPACPPQSCLVIFIFTLNSHQPLPLLLLLPLLSAIAKCEACPPQSCSVIFIFISPNSWNQQCWDFCERYVGALKSRLTEVQEERGGILSWLWDQQCLQ